MKTKDSPSSHYRISINNMRALAILAVVGIHTSTKTIEASGYDITNFPLSMFLNQILRFAVPLFFAISGFTLELNFPKYKDLFSFYKKRLSKIVIPYIFWSIIYFTFIFNLHRTDLLKGLLDNLIKGTASYQLYFIPSLMVFYLLFPLLHKHLRFLTGKKMLSILFMTELMILYKDYFYGEIKIYETFRFVILNFFIFIFGMLAAHKEKRIIEILTRYKTLFFGGSIFLGYYVFQEGSMMYLKYKNYMNIYSQWRPSVLIYSIFLFLTLFYIFEKQKSGSKIFRIFSENSFFIYFVHIIIMEFVYKSIGKYFYNYPGFDIFFLFTVAGISLLLGLILRKIPYLSRLIG